MIHVVLFSNFYVDQQQTSIISLLYKCSLLYRTEPQLRLDTIMPIVRHKASHRFSRERFGRLVRAAILDKEESKILSHVYGWPGLSFAALEYHKWIATQEHIKETMQHPRHR